MNNTSPLKTRVFYVPKDFRDRSFLDVFADVFADPEDLTLYQPEYGFMARIRDGQRIRGDFRKAINLLAEESKQKTGAPPAA